MQDKYDNNNTDDNFLVQMSNGFMDENTYNKYCPLQSFLKKIFKVNLIQEGYIHFFNDIGYTFDKPKEAYCKGVKVTNLQVGKQHEYIATVISCYSPCLISPVSLKNFHTYLGQGGQSSLNYFINFLIRFPVFMYNERVLIKSNVASLYLFLSRREEPNQNIFIQSSLFNRNILARNPQNLLDAQLDIYKDIFAAHFDDIIAKCFVYYYNKEHSDDIFDLCFFVLTNRITSITYVKNTFHNGGFDIIVNFNSTMMTNIDPDPEVTATVSLDGYVNRDEFLQIVGNGNANFANAYKPPFGMFVTLPKEDQTIFFRFIGSLLWYWARLCLTMNDPNERPLLIYLWGTLLYRKDINVNHTFNYDTLLYNLNECLAKKIFYISNIANDNYKYLPAGRGPSFHCCIPYKYSRFEVSTNLLLDFYPFVSFFQKIYDKPEVLTKLTDFGRNLLSRFLQSQVPDSSNIYIPGYNKIKK